MACLIGCLLVISPRLALLAVALFTSYVGQVYGKAYLWPILGFIFLPITTLAYIWAYIQSGGQLSGFYIAVIVFAVLMDLGMVSGAGQHKYRSVRGVE